MFCSLVPLVWLLNISPYCALPEEIRSTAPLQQSERIEDGSLTIEERELLVRALKVVADEVAANARGMLDVRNRTVELARAERIRTLATDVAGSSNEALVGQALLEYRRNVGINSRGLVEVGLQLPLSRKVDPLVRETLKAFQVDSRGAPFSVEHYVPFRLSKDYAGEKIHNSEELMNLLGVDHPVVVQALAKATKTEPQFIRANVLAARALGTSPLHLLTVYRVETINTFGTGYYPSVGTVGLINWTPTGTLMHEKVTSGEFSKEEYLKWLSRLSRSDQVNEVVEYLQDRREIAGNYHSVAGVYLSVLNPSALKEYRQKGLAGVVFSVHENSLYYHANRNLDADRDSIVSVGEVIQRVMDHRNALLEDAKPFLEQGLSFSSPG
jgi:hypothetical protein